MFCKLLAGHNTRPNGADNRLRRFKNATALPGQFSCHGYAWLFIMGPHANNFDNFFII